MGYHPDVFVDEAQAYHATSTHEQLVRRFGDAVFMSVANVMKEAFHNFKKELNW